MLMDNLNINNEINGVIWNFQRVFDTKQKAIDACKDWTYFIGPEKFNESLIDETKPWLGCYYPVPQPV